MRSTFRRPSRLALLILLVSPHAWADTATDAYRAAGIEPHKVLTGTVLNSQVVPGSRKQVVCVTTYLTGNRDKANAVNVQLDVLERTQRGLVPVYTRDVGEENGGYVADGDLQLLDLDRDGVQEIILSYDSYQDPLIEQRLAQVILHDDSGFRTAWKGAVEYDATRAVRDVPPERRDRFHRDFDFPSTLRTHGRTLFINKRMVAVAGQRLPQPQIVQETFPLRSRPAAE